MNPDCTFSMTRPAWVDEMLIESYLQVSPALERVEKDRALRERLTANVREIDRHLREISERYQVPASMFYPRPRQESERSGGVEMSAEERRVVGDDGKSRMAQVCRPARFTEADLEELARRVKWL